VSALAPRCEGPRAARERERARRGSGALDRPRPRAAAAARLPLRARQRRGGGGTWRWRRMASYQSSCVGGARRTLQAATLSRQGGSLAVAAHCSLHPCRAPVRCMCAGTRQARIQPAWPTTHGQQSLVLCSLVPGSCRRVGSAVFVAVVCSRPPACIIRPSARVCSTQGLVDQTCNRLCCLCKCAYGPCIQACATDRPWCPQLRHSSTAGKQAT
jgi:hypothetical protein